MALHVGESAPDFTLFNTEKKAITLSQHRGQNILLLFFPLAFTSVCTAELCSVRDNFTIYESLNAKIFGISVDSLYTLAKYKEEQKLNFDLLSDFNKEVSKTYDALYETFGYGMQGVSKRAAFLIDEEGIIRYAEVLENAGLQPNFEAIKETLTAIQV
jgi:glutaredoxin-dependent peroxiredoxin